jgi:hypothetical protein
MTLLTLDHTTLFYWNFSDTAHNKRKRGDEIKNWSSQVQAAAPGNSKPASKASRSITGLRSRVAPPSLTTGESRGSAPSILTDGVEIITSKPVKVKTEPAPVAGFVINDVGAISDNDETRGDERDLAIISPPKGKKRLTSEVRVRFFLTW